MVRMARVWMMLGGLLVVLGPGGCSKKKEPVPRPTREVRHISEDVMGLPAQVELKTELGSRDSASADLHESDEADRLRELLDRATSRQDCNIVMGCRAGEELVEFGPAAIPAIIQRYGELRKHSYQKVHLIELLGELGDAAAVPFLSALLEDPHWNSRANAAWSLAQVDARGQRPHLEELLATHAHGRDWGFSCSLAFAVEKLGGSGGREIILEALSPASISSRNTGFTRIAVRAAAELKMDKVCPLLKVAMDHPEIFLKKEAFRTAASLNCADAAVRRSLAAGLSARVPSVRKEAVTALKKLTGYEFKTFEQWQKYENTRDGGSAQSH
jgi:hypothetical protein